MELKDLIKLDYELIEAAQKAITKNYDRVNYYHTVGAAVRCKNGNVYTGVNVYTSHGACAEFIAIGTAITAGEREFECIVSVRGEKGEEILPLCGNCRVMLMQYAPNCDVILNANNKVQKVAISELLPFYCK